MSSGNAIYIWRPGQLPCDFSGGLDISEPMKAERSTFRQLVNSPHKNIVEYKGFVLGDGRVVALCLIETLSCNLYDAVQNKQLGLLLGKRRIMLSLRKAVPRLNELGIRHNDAAPSNSMLDSMTEVI